VFCLEVLIYKCLQKWRHSDVIGRNEYIISTWSESTVPYVYSLQFLFKTTHHSWRYGTKCEWVFFFWTQCRWLHVKLMHFCAKYTVSGKNDPPPQIKCCNMQSILTQSNNTYTQYYCYYNWCSKTALHQHARRLADEYATDSLPHRWWCNDQSWVEVAPSSISRSIKSLTSRILER